MNQSDLPANLAVPAHGALIINNRNQLFSLAVGGAGK